MLRTLSKSIKCPGNSIRRIHVSTVSKIREIIVEKKGPETTVIDCKYIKSPREKYVLKTEDKSDTCPLCRLKLNLKHTDVLILCQYIDSQGNILKHEDTSLCKDQYKLVTELIYMAQYAGLLPGNPRLEPKKPYDFLNTYYDETTINLHPVENKRTLRTYYLNKKLSPIEKLRIRPEMGLYYGPKIP